MADSEFDIEVPEADRLEQLQDASPGGGLEEYEPDDAPTVDAALANPADVLEQHIPVLEDDDGDQDEDGR